MAFDPEGRRIILYGGETCSAPYPDEPIGCEYQKNAVALNDTWAWDGRDWSQLQIPPGPQVQTFGSNLIGASADEKRRRLVMVARAVTATEPSAETWTFHAGVWQELHPAHVPWVWDFEGPAFDPSRGQLVIANAHGPHIDCGSDPRCKPYVVPAAMWAWNGSDWENLSSSRQPPLGYGALVRTASGLLSLDGNTPYQWNGSKWDAGEPLPWEAWLQRVGWAFVYDAATRTVLLYGGREWGRNHLYGDLLGWNGRRWQTLAAAPSPPIVTPLSSCNLQEALAGEVYGPDRFAIGFTDPLRGPCHLAVTVKFTLIGKDGTPLQIPGNPSYVSIDKDLTPEARTTRVNFKISGACRIVEGEIGEFAIGDWQLSEQVFGNPSCDELSSEPLSIGSSIETIP